MYIVFRAKWDRDVIIGYSTDPEIVKEFIQQRGFATYDITGFKTKVDMPPDLLEYIELYGELWRFNGGRIISPDEEILLDQQVSNFNNLVFSRIDQIKEDLEFLKFTDSELITINYAFDIIKDFIHDMDSALDSDDNCCIDMWDFYNTDEIVRSVCK